MNFINFILLLSLLLTSVFGSNDFYFITTPNLLITETPHVFNVHTSTDLIISIETVHQPSKIRHQGPVHVVKKGYQSIPYYVPFVGSQVGSKIQLNFKGNICNNLENCKSSKVVDGSFINKIYVLGLIDKNFIIFAETDKPIYKPGEKVKFRFMPIYPTNLMREPASVGKTWEIVLNSDGKYKSIEVQDNKTVQEFDLIIIENPDGVRVAQWRNVNIEKSMNLEYQLTKDPVFGIWKSKAVFKGQEEIMEFTVKKYVLPRFVVEVTPPDEILANDNEIKIKVCAKYSTGKTMKAKILGTFCLTFDHNKNCKTFQSSLNKVECLTIHLKHDALNFVNDFYYRVGNSKSVTNVTVTELKTTSSVSKVIEGNGLMFTPYKIKFLSKTYFKPGLPYFGKVSLLRHNDTPQKKTTVEISIKDNNLNRWGFSRNYISDESGLIDFIIPYIPAHFPIEIRIKGDGNETKSPMNIPVLHQRLSNWASVDKQYLQIQSINKYPKCPGIERFMILTNYDPSSIDMYAQTFSRGQIIQMNFFKPVPTKCESRDDSIGHYICNKDSTITCLPGYQGDNCREPICDEDCIHGACIEPNKCICKIGWVGSNCDKCMTASYCKNGYCKYGGDCQCYPGWRNYDCSRKDPKIHYNNYEPISPISMTKPRIIKTPGKQTIFERIIEIPLTKQMGPDVHIVVYFITPNKEVVADAIEISNGLSNCSHVGGGIFSFNKNSSLPKSKVVLRMDSGMKNTSCAVRIEDIALFQYKKFSNANLPNLIRKLIDLNHQITIDTRHRNNNAKLCISVGRVKRMIWPDFDWGFDSSKAFATAGFTTITNARIINSKCQHFQISSYEQMYLMEFDKVIFKPNPMLLYFRNPINISSKQLKNIKKKQLKIKSQIREYFPESWLFTYFNRTTNVLDLTVPDSMTTWKADAYCMTEKGIWIAPSQTLQVVLPFYVDVYVPYSMKLYEKLSLPVKLFNYAQACYEISIKLNVNDSQIKAFGHKSVTFCVCNNDENTIYFNIQPKTIGKLNITLDAVSKYSIFCSKNDEKKPDIDMHDSIRRKLFVEPQGVPTDTTFSELICNKNEQIGIKEIFSIPTNIVIGSLRSYLTFNGDVMGQTFDNLDKLVKMPYGCGEQNMVAVVPSIYVLEYLNGLKIKNPVLSEKAKQYIIEGYTRQMTYKHDDGSFSAFGKSDKAGSTWLTSFVLRSFSDANKYVDIKKIILREAVKYLEKMQLPSGCFKEEGKLFSSSMAGGLEKSGVTDESLLTAYVLISLKNIKKNKSILNIDKAVSCVELALMTNSSNYRLALTAYVLSLYRTNSQSIKSVMEQLLNRSVKSGRYQYWPYDKDVRDNTKINSADIETTGYAFLALQNHQSVPDSLKTVYWLSNQRNSLGGYYSTQDTVVALNALSVFAGRIGLSGTVNLNVSILLNRKHTYSDLITEDNRLVSRTYNLESENISYISIKTSGIGCVSVQLISLYNIEKLYSAKDVFKLTAQSTTPSDKMCNYRNVKVCFSYLRRDKNSNMILLTINYPSGWQVSNKELESLKEQIATPLNRIDFQNTKMELYYDAFSYNDAGKEYFFQFQLEEVSKISNLKSAFIRIQDYYSPELYTDASYSIFDKTCNERNTTKILEKPNILLCPKCINDSEEGSNEFVKMICESRFSGLVLSTNKRDENSRVLYKLQQSIFYEWQVQLEPTNCSCFKNWPNIYKSFVILSKRYESLNEKLLLSNDSVMFPLESLYSAYTFDLRNQCSIANNVFTLIDREVVNFSRIIDSNNSCPSCIMSRHQFFMIKNMTEWFCAKHLHWNLIVTSISPIIEGVLKNNNSVIKIEIGFPSTLCYCHDSLKDRNKTFRIIDLKNEIKTIENKPNNTMKLLLNNEFQIAEEDVYKYNKDIKC